MTNSPTQANAAQFICPQQSELFPQLTAVRSCIDVPTLTVAFAVYAGYAALTYLFQDMPKWIAAPLGAIWLTWYGSLQHETIHDHPTPWRGFNMSLGSAPLSLWLPYRLYRATHLQHHRHGGRRLTDVNHDPESFYLHRQTRSGSSYVFSALYRANCTLAGRLVLGPALSVSRLWLSEFRKAVAGDRGRRITWARHFVAVAMVLYWTTRVCHIPILVYLLMVYSSIALTHLRSFAEHRAHEESELRTVAVEANPLWALLFLNNNLHIAHHAHPRLQWYQLPKVWRQMRGRAVDAGLVVTGGYSQVMGSYLLRPVISVEHPCAVSDRLEVLTDETTRPAGAITRSSM